LAARVSIGDKVRLEGGETAQIIRIHEGEVTFVRSSDPASKDKIARRELEQAVFDGRAEIVSGARLAVAGYPDYKRSYLEALAHYREWAPKDRFERNLLSRGLTHALALKREDEFSDLFTDISSVIHESEGKLEIGDLSVLLKDIVDFRPELKPLLRQYMVRLAAETGTMEHVIETATKALRGMEIGEVVLVSPETLASGSSGGLAVAVTELAEALADLGIHVTVVTPLFAKVKKHVMHHYGLSVPSASVEVRLGSHGAEAQQVPIYPAKIGRVRHLFLENPDYFDSLNDDDGKSAYKGDTHVKLRFNRIFSAAALLAVRKMNIFPSVLQLNDHTTGPAVGYLNGRDRVDPEVQGLRADPHFARTKVMMIVHNAEKGYQGRIYLPHNQKMRDHLIRHHLGMDPAHAGWGDWKVLFMPGQWFEVNPTFMAVEEADHVRTVSPNYFEKSLDPAFEDEFGGLTGALRHRASQGRYDGVLNGIGLVEKQRKLFGKSFFEIGDEGKRRAFARKIFDEVTTVKKSELQKAFALSADPNAFLFSMLHRIDRQKGHQLLLMNIFDTASPDVLKTPAADYREDIFGRIEGIEGQVYPLSQDERKALLDHCRKTGRTALRAAEVAMILWPDLQMVIAGKADKQSDAGRFYDEGFSQLKAWFPDQFRYPGEFINARDARYDLIYSGSTVFDMPSYFEPGGISNQEAAAFGVVRHTSRRDGLRDGEISFNGVHEGFDPYNPVAWFVSLKDLRDAYRDKRSYKDTNWTVWDELRYRAFTQDNRWQRKAKNYSDKYQELAGVENHTGLAALEVSAAVHLAEIQGKDDASDELMQAGFTVAEALETVKQALKESNDEAFKALLTAKAAHLRRISDRAGRPAEETGARLAEREGADQALTEAVTGGEIRILRRVDSWEAPRIVAAELVPLMPIDAQAHVKQILAVVKNGKKGIIDSLVLSPAKLSRGRANPSHEELASLAGIQEPFVRVELTFNPETRQTSHLKVWRPKWPKERYEKMEEYRRFYHLFEQAVLERSRTAEGQSGSRLAKRGRPVAAAESVDRRPLKRLLDAWDDTYFAIEPLFDPLGRESFEAYLKKFPAKAERMARIEEQILSIVPQEKAARERFVRALVEEARGRKKPDASIYAAGKVLIEIGEEAAAPLTEWRAQNPGPLAEGYIDAILEQIAPQKTPGTGARLASFFVGVARAQAISLKNGAQLALDPEKEGDRPHVFKLFITKKGDLVVESADGHSLRLARERLKDRVAPAGRRRISVQDMLFAKKDLESRVHTHLSGVTADHTKPVVVIYDLDIQDNGSFDVYLQDLLRAFRQAKKNVHGRHAYFMVEGRQALVEQAMREGSDILLKEAPAFLKNAPRVLVGLAEEGLRKDRINLPVLRLRAEGQEADLPAHDAQLLIAGYAGRIDLQRPQDGFVNAYSTMAGARLSAGTLSSILRGTADRALAIRYALKSLLGEALNTVMRALEMSRRMAQQSA
jgi:glycogen synthase